MTTTHCNRCPWTSPPGVGPIEALRVAEHATDRHIPLMTLPEFLDYIGAREVVEVRSA